MSQADHSAPDPQVDATDRDPRAASSESSAGERRPERWDTLEQAARYVDRIVVASPGEVASVAESAQVGAASPDGVWRLTLLTPSSVPVAASTASPTGPWVDPGFRAEAGALAIDAGARRVWWVCPAQDEAASGADAGTAVWTLAELVDALVARGVVDAHLALETPRGGELGGADRTTGASVSHDRAQRALMRAQLVGFALAQYRFARYKNVPKAPRLTLGVPPALIDAADVERIQAMVAGVTLARDLINAAPNDMMPVHLALVARDLGARHAAGLRVISDDEQLEEGFPLVATVGRASKHTPRVIEWTSGPVDAPHWAVIGKGVCFDSGGLNLKPGDAMRWMKKDMGGAAIALGLAHAVALARLPVRLSVLIGAVENAVAGDAFRPGDVITARNGKTVEIDNTDAEGRLVLADLLVRASELRPDHVIDIATLTGAARVAVGTEISALFADEIPRGDLFGLLDLAAAIDDPIAPLPLHRGYRASLDSDVADLVNSAGGPGGAITAALFLREFAPRGRPWLHFDLMAFNQRARPGRPKGGEAMALRALFEWLAGSVEASR